MQVVLDNLDVYLEGMRTTVALTLLSFAAALVIGTMIASFRVSPIPPLRGAGAVYVELIRNTPLAVLITLFFFGLPKAGIQFDSFFVSAVIVLSAYTSTFVAETVRSGINTVAVGQAEAARSLGLTFPQVLFVVVLPQAMRAVAAPLGSVFIALIKNSAIASIIGVIDLTFVADQVANDNPTNAIAAFLGSAVGYLLLALPSGWAVARLERRTAIKR
ncbi:MAG TPA: amino acid ABC transporter permease [Acidimicrobiales bacterium]|nr:amino acid ABC transporter permease [Acidimicrobiales bacterium]